MEPPRTSIVRADKGYESNQSGDRSKIMAYSTYLTTKWFIFLFVPIIPLGSMVSEDYLQSFTRAVYPFQAEKVSLDIGMVLRTFAAAPHHLCAST